MQTDAKAVERELHSQPVYSKAIEESPGPPANLLGFSIFSESHAADCSI